jgi:hypothetical protein
MKKYNVVKVQRTLFQIIRLVEKGTFYTTDSSYNMNEDRSKILKNNLQSIKSLDQTSLASTSMKGRNGRISSPSRISNENIELHQPLNSRRSLNHLDLITPSFKPNSKEKREVTTKGNTTGYITGLKVEISGKLTTQHRIPRKTTYTFSTGSLSSAKY